MACHNLVHSEQFQGEHPVTNVTITGMEANDVNVMFYCPGALMKVDEHQNNKRCFECEDCGARISYPYETMHYLLLEVKGEINIVRSLFLEIKPDENGEALLDVVRDDDGHPVFKCNSDLHLLGGHKELKTLVFKKHPDVEIDGEMKEVIFGFASPDCFANNRVERDDAYEHKFTCVHCGDIVQRDYERAWYGASFVPKGDPHNPERRIPIGELEDVMPDENGTVTLEVVNEEGVYIFRQTIIQND